MSAASSPSRQDQPEGTALVQAAEAGDAGSVEVLIAAGAHVNAATPHGMTALMSAAANGHLGLVSVLIERGADINAKRLDGLNALALAAFFGHVHVVRELLGKGADIEARSRFGSSPEMWATVRGFHEITQILIDAKRVNSGKALETRNIESTACLPESEQVRKSTIQETDSAEEVEVARIPVQSFADSKPEDEWTIESMDSMDSIDSSEQTIEMSPAYVWNAADQEYGKGGVRDTHLGTVAGLLLASPVASPNAKIADTFIPARTERPRAFPVENQPSPIHSAPVARTAAYTGRTAYLEFVPFLAHITSDWRRLTVATLVVMLACGGGTLAFLQLLNPRAPQQAAKSAENIATPSVPDLKDSVAFPEDFSSSKSEPGTVTTNATNRSLNEQLVGSASPSGTGLSRSDVALIERPHKPAREERSLRKASERTTSPKSTQPSTSTMPNKRLAQAAKGRTDRFALADVPAKTSPPKGAPATAGSERAAKVQPPSTPAPLSIEVQRPRSVSARNDSPAAVAPPAGIKNSKSKVIRWP